MDLREFTVEEQIVLLASRADFNEDILENINNIVKTQFVDWDKVVGIMITNRLNGVVLEHLQGQKVFPSKTKETLSFLFSAQKEIGEIQSAEITQINNLFINNHINSCFLKGAVLNNIVYKKGTRISSDTDILVEESDLEKCVKVLEGCGYIQGNIKDDEIIPADRREKLFARVNTYELVPLHKKMNSRFLPFHTVDINYRLGNSENAASAKELLKNSILLTKDDFSVNTMELESFFIFLCVHLYREATMVLKIMDGEDLAVYKFMDIHYMAIKYREKLDYDKMHNMCIKMAKNKEVFYTMYHTELLYPETFSKDILDLFKTDNTEYLDEYRGRDNSAQVYKWNIPFEKRVFNRRRVIDAKKNIEEENKRYNEIMKELRNN